MAKLKGVAKREFLARMKKGRKHSGGGRRRRRNPILGVNVQPMIRSGLGIAVGAYVGNMITAVIGNNLISKIGSGAIQSLGYAVGAVGELILGEWLNRRVKALPMAEIAMGASVSMFLKAFEALNIVPLGFSAADVPVNDETQQGYFPRRRRPRRTRAMRGSFIGQPLPGGMAGTIQPLPRSMAGFGGLLS